MSYTYPTHPRFVDLTNKRFGLLTALGPIGSRPKGGTIWRAQCDCGKITDVDGATLRCGRTNSCGCEMIRKRAAGNNTTHGKSRTGAHNVWVGMRQRCENPNSHAFKHYGGRGITVCDRWQEFENFFLDMGEKPKGMTLDRVDNDKGYSPENCRWATRFEQAANKRNTARADFDGVSVRLKDISAATGIPYKTIFHRHKVGKTGAALVAPLRKDSKRKVKPPGA